MAANRLVRRKPKTRKFIDRTGKRYGKLTVESFVGFKGVHSVWRVRCDCGTVETCFGTRLGESNSHHWACRNCNGRDGRSEHPLHAVWHSMKGKKRLCAEWLDFQSFVSAVGTRPKGKILCRPDRSKPFGPGNWKWGTHSEAAGKIGFKLTSVSGEVLSVVDWCSRLGISRQCLHQRLKKMPEHVAVSYPAGKTSPEHEAWLFDNAATRRQRRWREKHLQKLAKSFERLASGDTNGHIEPERLTHDARRERRRKIAEAVCAGKKPSEVCQEFGVGMGTLASALEEFS
jgi:hypothetical protein